MLLFFTIYILSKEGFFWLMHLINDKYNFIKMSFFIIIEMNKENLNTHIKIGKYFQVIGKKMMMC